MSNKDVVFEVDIKSLILDADQLTEITQFLRTKKFMSREYKGKNSGFAGGEYDFKLVSCDEKARIEIKPVPENIWLYLNTFGKEVK